MAIAVVLGGNGLIGAAAARGLRDAGWTVTCSGRSERRFPSDLRARGVRFSRSDRYDPQELRQLLRAGADVVVDCVGYTAAHSQLLLDQRDRFGSMVYVSSKAVYVDDHGRHVNSAQPPEFPGPVTEQQATMAASAVDYHSPAGYGANKVAAEQLLLDSGLPVSVLRPSCVHGVGAARPREWVFLRRVLDGRDRVLLARGGRGVNHPTAAVNLAELVRVCAESPGARIVNSADPDAPDGLTIARVIAAHLGHRWAEVLLADDAPEGLGDHPWNEVPPIVLDTTAGHALGYVPVGDYAETVTAELDWLVAAAGSGDPERVLPAADDPYYVGLLDYVREDAWPTL